MPNPTTQILIVMSLLGFLTLSGSAADDGDPIEPFGSDESTYFESHVRPLLEQNCFECHSHDAKIKGGLALDSVSGILQGGEGGAIIQPGIPEESRLIEAIQYTDEELRMPPDRKLADDEIAILVNWVKEGADGLQLSSDETDSDEHGLNEEWESIYQKRLTWWSLQPLSASGPPKIMDSSWPRNTVDHFILAKLEAEGLPAGIETDRRTLARRLSFALLGLPPKPEEVERFLADDSPSAYEDWVESLLDNPHFGERWARHWMDVVHYSDTHGYEWDTPAKNAWMYRDYLVRAFNDDISFKQLILEQIAGDLIEPRINPDTGLNESIIGPTAMRLGERRHGDNADAEGISQEMVANVIDTLSKGFIGTTVACAQCHDHKLDAVEQRDYYGLAGLLMSSRWISRSADATDPNLETLAQLKKVKTEIRDQLKVVWKDSESIIHERILAAPVIVKSTEEDSKKKSKKDAQEEPAFPDSLKAIWDEMISSSTTTSSFKARWSELVDEFTSEREKRTRTPDRSPLLIADFTKGEIPPGWKIDGFGMKHGLVEDGEMVVSDSTDEIVFQILPAGRWTHVWSQRLAGAVRSPLFSRDSPPVISVGYAGGKFSGQSLVVDHALHSERMKFFNQEAPGWLTLDTGHLRALAGGPDQKRRRVYLEMVTKSLNNYFPPRTKYGGSTEEEERDERSWFGLTHVYQHPEDQPPTDELERFVPLFSEESIPQSSEELATRIANLGEEALDHWIDGNCDGEDVRLINDLLRADWLPNDPQSLPELSKWVEEYRQAEKELRPDRVIGTVEDWNEGENERIAVRGSYMTFGDEVPRGNIRFLGGPGSRVFERSSGRLEWARDIASEANPLTARVFVNRVWHYLFGSGLVRTVDDFGHLGETPSHPELLDWLANRFMEEGWSVKALIRLIVTSSTWRQSSIPCDISLEVDPENRFLHYMPMRRLEAESIRDAVLAVSGHLDDTLFGPPVDPHRVAEDPAKRLYSGPVDGNGRRSLYIKTTLMEPSKFLAVFNQPIPKLTTGKRDTTNVPNQALAMLNDPFVVEMANRWSERLMEDGSESARQRIEQMFASAFARPPNPDETTRFVRLANQCAQLRGVDVDALIGCQPVWRDVAHAIFNLKEFIYVE